MNRIAIIRGQGKDELGNVQKDVARLIKGYGLSPVITEKEEDIKSCDMIISLGGDGSILSLARRMSYLDIPVLGINLGQTGFLTELELTHIEKLEDILSGNYILDERMMLEAETSDGTKIVALNDICIKSSRMVITNIFVDTMMAYKYNGDGVVVSTATGSTAYSRNVGGPVAQPNMELFIINPVAPTKRFSDSLLIPSHHDILINTLGTKTKEDVKLIIDGQESMDIQTTDNIFIKKAPNSLKLVRRNDTSFYKRLIDKL